MKINDNTNIYCINICLTEPVTSVDLTDSVISLDSSGDEYKKIIKKTET